VTLQSIVAISPTLRSAYVAKCLSLLKPGGKILLVAIEYEQDKMSGPPFSTTEEMIRQLYVGCDVKVVDKRDALEDNPRFVKSGLLSVPETCYLITKLK
jgi:thiopurine S-methyltransferase